MTSNGKQFSVTREMLTTVARDQRWPDVAGVSARFSKFVFVLFPYITRCSPDFVSGNKIHCSTRDQFLNLIKQSRKKVILNGLSPADAQIVHKHTLTSHVSTPFRVPIRI